MEIVKKSFMKKMLIVGLFIDLIDFLRAEQM